MSSNPPSRASLLIASQDPALYPHFDIYPHVPLTIGSNTAAQETQLALIQRCMPAALISAYPALNICTFSCAWLSFSVDHGPDPDVYPAFNIYPDISGFHRYSSQEHTHASMSQMYGYPYFDICKEIVNCFEVTSSFVVIDPAVEELDVAPVQKSMPVFLNAQYPSFNICQCILAYLLFLTYLSSPRSRSVPVFRPLSFGI